MKYLFVNLLFFIGFTYSEVIAQGDKNPENPIICGSDELHASQMKSDPAYRERYSKMNREMAKFMDSALQNKNFELSLHNDEWTIPVVVHVISDGQFNISDQTIHDAIRGLNDRFRGRIGRGQDTRINFCLATKAPNGTPSTGINRVNGSHIPSYFSLGIGIEGDCSGASERTIKDLSKWPANQYYNIWIVNKICNGRYGGYAYYPTTGSNDLDGSVVIHNAFTYDNLTLAHELGHGLNLAHTFQGGNETSCPSDFNCLIDGDLICDTPPHRIDDCGISNPCTTSGNWDNSRYNYMSYCFTSINFGLFTPQQVIRMRLAIQNYRSSLIASNGCGGTPCQPPTNNQCSNATAITSNGNCLPGTITCASQSLPPNTCSGFLSAAAPDVWYKFVANSSSHTITVIPAASLDAVVELRKGPSCNGSLISCRDNGGGPGSNEVLTATGLIVGETYFVRVYPYYLNNPPISPTFQICVTHTATQTCATPTSTNETTITQTSATIKWNNVSNVSSYYYQYRAVGTQTFTYVATNNTSATINGLICGTEYEWEVGAYCLNTIYSQYSQRRKFRTANCPVCNSPPQPGAISGSNSVCAGPSITYSISPVQGALSYSWSYTGGGTPTGSGTSINFSPTSSGTLSVIAHNACGGSTPRNLSITVNQPLGVVEAISGNTIVCQGRTQTYSINQVSAVTSYRWNLPTGWTGNSTTNSINATVGSSGGTISVVVSNLCGTTTRFLTVSMGQLPAQPGTISGKSTVCSGSSQTYTISPVAGATRYSWAYSGGGSPSGSINSTTFSPTSSGTLSVVAQNGCGSGSARNFSIVVNQPPGIVGAISGNTNACEGTSQTYSISPIGSATSYTWSFPQGWSGSSTTNSISVMTGNGSGSIRVHANNNCGAGQSRSLNISINPKPNQPGTISGSTNICLGSPATYSIGSVQGATSYSWTYSGNGTPVGNGSTITLSPTSSGSLSVVGNNTCGAGVARTLNINVSQVPKIQGNISGNPTPCRGNTQIYSVNPVLGANSYNWEVPSGWVGSSTSNTISLVVGATNGIVRARAVNQCGAGEWVQMNVNNLTVPPQPGLISGNQTPCEDVQTQYSVANLFTADNYIWTKPSGWTGNSTTRTLLTTPSITGGNITVRGSNVCGSGPIRSFPVQVIPKVTPSITIAEKNCIGNSIEFSANIVNGGANPTFQWVVNGVSEGSNSPTFTLNFAVNGMKVECNMTSNAQCPIPRTVKSNVAEVTCAAPPTIQVECVEMFLVFPNPVNDQIYIKLRTTCTKKLGLKMINARGQVLQQPKEIDATGYITETFETKALPNGVYYIVLLVDGKPYPTKVVVMH